MSKPGSKAKASAPKQAVSKAAKPGSAVSARAAAKGHGAGKATSAAKGGAVAKATTRAKAKAADKAVAKSKTTSAGSHKPRETINAKSGAKRGMIANNNANKNKGVAAPAVAKKKAAAERTSKQAAELARKPLQAEPVVPGKAAKTPEAKAQAPKAAQPKAPQAKTPQAKAPQAKTVAKAPAAKPVAAAKPALAQPAVAAKPAAPAPAKAAKPAPAPEAKSADVAQAAPKKALEKPVDPQAAAKKANQRQGFKTQEYIVYPAHGVGQIMAIEEQEVAGYKLELFVISFAKDKMTLRVPTTKVGAVGMRKLAEPALVKRALETLKGRARIKRTMWSRRAQEYEAKINSGDIVAISEVVRDLYRSESQPEQSYSERQLYEAALDRLAREIAAVDRVTETEAIKLIEGALAKGPRRGPKGAEAAEATEAGDGEGDDFVAEEAA